MKCQYTKKYLNSYSGIELDTECNLVNGKILGNCPRMFIMAIKEITSFMDKDYKNSIDIYERILSYSIRESDFLAQGAKKYLEYIKVGYDD